MSKEALLVWGLPLCKGTAEDKATIFYDLLQNKGQERISADDKDFEPSFFLLIDLHTKVVNTYEAVMSKKTPELNRAFLAKIEQAKPGLAEEFVDFIFDVNSNLERSVYEKRVQESKTKYVFNAHKLRNHVYKFAK